MKRFLDTNLFVYAVSVGPKQALARDVLADGGVISVQVLNEFVAVMRRKHQRSWADISEALAVFREAFPVVLPVTSATHDRACALAARDSLSIYDALIVAAAMDGGCDVLLTEDLQAGRLFGLLEVKNPFVSG